MRVLPDVRPLLRGAWTNDALVEAKRKQQRGFGALRAPWRARFRLVALRLAPARERASVGDRGQNPLALTGPRWPALWDMIPGGEFPGTPVTTSATQRQPRRRIRSAAMSGSFRRPNGKYTNRTRALA